MAETFILGTPSNMAPTTARIAVNQGTLPADFLEERYYLFDSGFYSGEEPSRTPDVIVTGSVSFVDVSNLVPGTIYTIQAWRRYTNAAKAHFKATIDTSAPVNYTPVLTALGTVAIDPTIRVYAVDFAHPGRELKLQWNIRNCDMSAQSDGVMGNYLHYNIANGGQGWTHTRRRFNRFKPITVNARIRFSSNGGYPWWAVGLSNGESEDATITHSVGGGTFSYSFNLPWTGTGVSLAGVYHDIEVSYNGINTFTYKVNGITLGAKTGPLTVDPFVYIGCTSEGAGSGAYFDISSLTITGEEVGGFSDAYLYYWHTINGSSVSGTEWQNGYPFDGTPHFHQQGGGLTSLMSNPGVLIPIYGMPIWMSRDQLSYHAGTSVFTSPQYIPISGYRYKSLRLTGSTRSGGTLKIYVRDSAGLLIPDSVVSGNSAGFTPTYGSELTINLQNVNTGPIYFDIQIYNPTEGIIDYNNYSSQSGPPILKALSVDFTEDTTGNFIGGVTTTTTTTTTTAAPTTTTTTTTAAPTTTTTTTAAPNALPTATISMEVLNDYPVSSIIMQLVIKPLRVNLSGHILQFDASEAGPLRIKTSRGVVAVRGPLTIQTSQGRVTLQ